MASRHFLAAIAVFAALPPAVAESGLQIPGVAAAAANTPNQECWLAHAQVQPPLLREDLLGKPSFSERYRLAAERHAGAEHPTPARLRPCNALSPLPKLAADAEISRP